MGTYVIADNYSVLNNYNFSGKSPIQSTLDWLSTPCRRVLGGRNVCVLSQMVWPKMGTSEKVATFIKSALIFPIAIVSIISLVARVVIFSPTKEKEKIVLQSNTKFQALQNSLRMHQEGNYLGFLRLIRDNPELSQRGEIGPKLIPAMNVVIGARPDWKEIQGMIRLFNPQDAIVYINLAIAKVSYSMSPRDVVEFIRNSLPDYVRDREDCYQFVLKKALKFTEVTPEVDLALFSWKLEIANHMIRTRSKENFLNFDDDLKLLMIPYEENKLRDQLFDGCPNTSMFYLPIFRDQVEMSKISMLLDSTRLVNRIGGPLLQNLSKIINESTRSDLLEKIERELKRASAELVQSKSSVESGESEFTDFLAHFVIEIKASVEITNLNLENFEHELDRMAARLEQLSQRYVALHTESAPQTTVVRQLLQALRNKRRELYRDFRTNLVRLCREGVKKAVTIVTAA